jgi:hypothetical protein
MPPHDPPHTRPGTEVLHHHDEDGFLDALELLISTGKARTAIDLVHFAERGKETVVVDFLKPLAEEDMPVQLAFDALRVHIRIAAHRRGHSLLKNVSSRTIGLVMPLPPHVLESFSSMSQVTVMIPDGHHLPPGLRGSGKQVLNGSRACRNGIASCQVLVFEAHRQNDTLTIDPDVADIVDLRIIPVATELLVHVRPHPHPNDISFTITQHSWKVL